MVLVCAGAGGTSKIYLIKGDAGGCFCFSIVGRKPLGILRFSKNDSAGPQTHNPREQVGGPIETSIE